MLLHKNTPGIQCSELMDITNITYHDFKKPSQKSPNLAPRFYLKLLLLHRILIFEQLFIPFVPVTKAKKNAQYRILALFT